MTNEEAIEFIKIEISRLWKTPQNLIYKEALEMAIKALEQEPCEDAISRRDMALNIVSFYNKATGKKKTLDFLCKCVERLPSMQPKQRTGHWKRISMDKYVQHAMAYYRCSECGKDIIGEHNYCPNCGAKMAESEDKE